MMIKIQDAIVEKLKDELEYFDKDNKYSQWILGVSIKKERENRIIGKPKYKASVVLKTSESPYVDGMDIEVTVPEDEIILEENYFENTPELQGSPVEDAIKWLKQLGEIYYLQIEDPYKVVKGQGDRCCVPITK